MPHDARAFLDLEAQVDRDDPEEDDDDDLGDFIDDEDNAADPGSPNLHLDLLRRRWFGDPDDHDHDDYDSNDDNAAEARRHITRDEACETHRWNLPSKLALETIVKPTDYPLWRVPCRQGIEREAVFDLLHTAANPKYELRSAFTRGSIHGHIYLEATMNSALIDLLKRTRGTRCQTLQYTHIVREEWEDLLTIRDIDATPNIGDWVLISRGLYRGDLAFVSTMQDWQGLSVLLIPRIAYKDECPPSSKRKRSANRPPPLLFDPGMVPKEARIQPKRLRDGIYKFGSFRLEKGLLRRSFDFHSISQGVLHIPTDVFFSFHRSKHSEMRTARFPCPLEFKFEENELVMVLPTNTAGRIKALCQWGLEVELLNGEGDVNVSWANVWKHVVLGDYVAILSGSHQGHEGFVTTVEGSSVTVTEFTTIPGTTVAKTMTAEVAHINSVKVIPSPYIHRPETVDLSHSNRSPQIDPLTKKFAVPWKHKYIIVSKLKHPAKGRHARVIDAIRPLTPSSKPTLVVQYESITGTRRDQLSYDDVVDASTSQKLFARFHKDHPFYFETPADDASSAPNVDGSVTPAWSPSSIDMSLSPAWDPSSRTPLIVDSGNETPVASSTSTTLQHASAAVPATATLPPAHPLLDPRLLGKSARVSVSAGPHPKSDATVSMSLGQDNGVTIRQSWRNQSFHLQPEWVTINHPNPTRDNGLLLVIRGDHCGKYVRRIHHDEHYAFQLAVVERINGAADALTEERITLPSDDLCQSFETNAEKRLNANLMSALREAARYPPRCAT